MKTKQKLMALLVAVSLSVLSYSPAVMAVETSVLPDNLDIMGLLKMVLRILSALVGIAGVGGILYGAIKYTTAGDSMDQTKEAKKIIFNVIFGLAAYGVGFAFMNFLIPGGLVDM